MPATIAFMERVIATFAAAAKANGEMPARQGHVIELTEDAADDVMITADLHGHRANFNAIRRIADLSNHPRRHLILQEVCHGGPTHPHGGCMSHTLLEDVAKLVAEFPDRVHFLLSNHELAELTDFPILKSKKMLNLSFRMGMQEAYGQAVDKVRDAAMRFIESCPLAARVAKGVFICHSLPERVDSQSFDLDVFDRPWERSDLLEDGDVFRVVWGRDFRPENARAFARLLGAQVLIHGHEPCPQGFDTPNEYQIILDCCADNGCYLLIPVGREWTQQELVAKIQRFR